MEARYLEVYSNQLLQFTFSEKSDNSTRVQALGEGLGRLVTESWDMDGWYAPHTLKAAKHVACLPSLRTVANSETHTQAVASEVATNFRHLAEDILYTPSLSPRALHMTDPDGPVAKGVIGELSEIGALGAMWELIARGLRGEKTYVLPTTLEQDSGRIKKDGFNIGTDIIMRTSGGTKDRRLMQVKTKLSRRNAAAINRYYPEMILIILSELVGRRERFPSYKLLGILQSGDDKQLTAINERVEDSIIRADARTKVHEGHKKRLLARSKQPTPRRRLRTH